MKEKDFEEEMEYIEAVGKLGMKIGDELVKPQDPAIKLKPKVKESLEQFMKLEAISTYTDAVKFLLERNIVTNLLDLAEDLTNKQLKNLQRYIEKRYLELKQFQTEYQKGMFDAFTELKECFSEEMK